MLPKPNIYISATPEDLAHCRAICRDVLLQLDCTPVVPPSALPESAAAARKQLRKLIAGCDTVIHIVGKCHGAEPSAPDASEARRSYRQMEHDIADELRKRVILFVCDKNFDYQDAASAAEPADIALLQQRYRDEVLAGKKIYTLVGSSAALEKRLYALQERMKQLVGEMLSARRRSRWIVAVCVLVVLGLGAWLWQLAGKMKTTESTVGVIGAQIDQMKAELDILRTRIDAVAKAFVQEQPEADRLNIPAETQYQNAVAKVAEAAQIPPALLSAQIQVFVKNTERTQEATDELDRARADFASRNFSAAAKGATRAALALRVERLAAAQAAGDAAAQAAQIREKAGEVKTFADGLQASGTTP